MSLELSSIEVRVTKILRMMQIVTLCGMMNWIEWTNRLKIDKNRQEMVTTATSFYHLQVFQLPKKEN